MDPEYGEIQPYGAAEAGIELRAGLGERIDLPSGSVHRIHIANVFNSDEMPTSSQDPSCYQQSAIIREAKRLLHPDGCVYVAADNEPQRFPLNKVLEIADRWNLDAEVLVSPEYVYRGHSQPKFSHMYPEADQKTYVSIVGATTLNASLEEQSYLVRLTPRREGN